MKRAERWWRALLLCALASPCLGVETSRPNVMILLDTSGSMGNSVSILAPYDKIRIYAPARYTSAAVYRRTPSGVYGLYADSIAAVNSGAARTSLSAIGFWFGNIGTDPLRLFAGNYLNYQDPGCTNCTKRSERKINIAKRVIVQLVGGISDVNFGVMRFMGGKGELVAAIGASSGAIIAAVNAINVTGNTPTGEALRDVGKYFSGNLNAPSPIQSNCQPNSVILISDGMWNGNIDPASQSRIEFNTDHSPLAGTQNLITNTIGFMSPSDNLQSLQDTADNGGGSHFSAGDVPALEQALFSLPSAVRITEPTQGGILSGTRNVTAYAQNSVCLQGVHYELDGSILSALIPSPPYTYNWDTTKAGNAAHTLTAVAQDNQGIVSVSQPIEVVVFNNLPIITPGNIDVGYTTATVAWQTNIPTDAQVYYGLTSAYDQATLLQDTNPRIIAHSVRLSGLTPATQYHLQYRSRDDQNNLAVFGDFTFMTLGLPSGGVLDHFKLTFLGPAGVQTGPGSKSGSYPYVLTAGECFSTTVEALDSLGNHSNFSSTAALAQYLLDESGMETALAPGLALRNSFQLGVSSMDVLMTNGFAFLGSETDFTKQICFYRATREPGDSKRPGAAGDLVLRVVKKGDNAITGVSDGFVAWRGLPDRLALLAPGQTFAPATPSGWLGAVNTQTAGAPFSIAARLTDRYWNQVMAANDTVSFASSLPADTGFNPFNGPLAGGALVSMVTVNACSPATLSVQDETSPQMAPGQVTVPIGSCGAQRFYQVSVPAQATAGQPFPVTITLQNLNLPVGGGDVLFSGRLVPLVAVDASHFAGASGLLAFPIFSFLVPEGTSGSYAHTLPAQSYRKAETIWLQLAADNPADLKGATAMGGPLQVVAGAAQRLSVTASQGTLPAYSDALLTAAVTDAFGNGISGQEVVLRITQGSGRLGSAGDLLSQSLITDGAGRAEFKFRSGGLSETVYYAAFTPSLSIPQAGGQILTSLLGDKRVAAYPSPVKITERPLTIEYKLDQNSDVMIGIADLFGRDIWRTSLPAGGPGGSSGFNRVTWDGSNGAGRAVAVGVYLLRLEINVNGQRQTASTKFGVRK